MSWTRRNLSIHDAQIFTNRDGMAIWIPFIVLEPDTAALAQDRHEAIRYALEQSMTRTYQPPRARRPSPKLRHFSVPARQFPAGAYRPPDVYGTGVLGIAQVCWRVGEVFSDLGLSLPRARIYRPSAGNQRTYLFWQMASVVRWISKLAGNLPPDLTGSTWR